LQIRWVAMSEDEAHLTDDEGATEETVLGYEAVEFVSQEEEEEAAKALARRRSSIKIGGGIQMALLNAGKLKVDNATSGIAGAFRKWAGKTSPPKDGSVYLLDGTDLIVHCPNGTYTTTKEMTDKVHVKVGVYPEDQPLFGLWIVSASLQLQLKPHHLPFKLLKTWHDVLEAYAQVNDGHDTYNEHPQLYWKRDALMHMGAEKKVESPLALKMLYHELGFNIAFGIYPISMPEAIEFAAMALKIEMGAKGTKAAMKDATSCNLPTHLKESGSWTWTWYRKVWKAYSAIKDAAGSTRQWQKQYLQMGHKYNYYGATFFYGTVEDDSKFVPDHVVRVGVNLDGIHVIDDHTHEIRLSMGYDEFSYNSYEKKINGTDASFLIEYTGETGAKEDLVVWSPQAAMIDTLASRFIELQKTWTVHVKERQARRQSFKPRKAPLGRKDSTTKPGRFTLGRRGQSIKAPAGALVVSGGGDMSEIPSASLSRQAQLQGFSGF